MRKQFETRVRLVIYMDARDLNRLTARAKREGRVLVAWAREVLMGELESKPLILTTTQRASITDPKLAKEIADFNSDIFTIKHTAQSNRLTCRCATCSEYRRVHDLPLGGLKRATK
jgi:hypothetical protein